MYYIDKKRQQLPLSSPRSYLIRSIQNCSGVHNNHSAINLPILILNLKVFLLKPNYASRENILYVPMDDGEFSISKMNQKVRPSNQHLCSKIHICKCPVVLNFLLSVSSFLDNHCDFLSVGVCQHFTSNLVSSEDFERKNIFPFILLQHNGEKKCPGKFPSSNLQVMAFCIASILSGGILYCQMYRLSCEFLFVCWHF